MHKHQGEKQEWLSRGWLIILATSSVICGCLASKPVPVFLEEEANFPIPGPAWSIAFSPDNKYVAVGTQHDTRPGKDAWSGDIAVWDVAASKEIFASHFDRWVNAVAFSPDGKRLAVATGTPPPFGVGHPDDLKTYKEKPGEVVLFEVPSFKLADRVELNTGGVWGIVFVSGGDLVGAVVGAWSTDPKSKNPPWEVRCWETKGLKDKYTVHKSPEGQTASLAVSPDGKTLAIGDVRDSGREGIIRLHDAPSGKHLSTFFTGAPSLTFAYSPNGKTIASVGKPANYLTVRDSTTGKDVSPTGLSRSYSPSPTPIAFSNDNLFAVYQQLGDSGEIPHFIWFWDMNKGTQQGEYRVKRRARALTFSPNGKLLAGACADGVCIWKVPPP